MAKSVVWCSRVAYYVDEPRTQIMDAIKASQIEDLKGWIYVTPANGDEVGRQVALNVAHISAVSTADGAGI